MAEPVRVRRLTDQAGQRLQRIVRRGSTSAVRYRRAMLLLASTGGNRVPVTAKLVQADEDGPLWQFTLANSNHPNHTVQTRQLHGYLRWRNANARHPNVLAAQLKEHARIRAEKGIRWGGRPLANLA